MAVNGAILDHPDLAVAFDNLRLDLADLFVHEVAPIFIAMNDGFASFFDAIRTQRIGLPRPAERRLGLFPRLEERFVRPFRSERRVRTVLVEELDGVKGGTRCLADNPIKSSQNLRAYSIRHKPHPLFREFP